MWQIQLLFSVYENQAVIPEFQPKRNLKEDLRPVSLIYRQAQQEQFSSKLPSRFSIKDRENFVAAICFRALTFTPFSIYSLDHPCCKVSVLFCGKKEQRIATNHSQTQGLHSPSSFSLDRNEIPVWFSWSGIPVTERQGLMLIHYFPLFSEMLQGLQCYHRILRPDLTL